MHGGELLRLAESFPTSWWTRLRKQLSTGEYHDGVLPVIVMNGLSPGFRERLDQVDIIWSQLRVERRKY